MKGAKDSNQSVVGGLAPMLEAPATVYSLGMVKPPSTKMTCPVE